MTVCNWKDEYEMIFEQIWISCLKKKNKQPNQPFLKENVQQILADSTVHKPKLYMEQEVVQNPLHGIVVYFIKAMPICTVIYEFDIVSIHVFHRTD